MKITIATALAAIALAFAPVAQAQEGNGNPFPFSVPSIGAVQFEGGVAVALNDDLRPTLAARGDAPLRPTAEVAEMPAEGGSAERYVRGR